MNEIELDPYRDDLAMEILKVSIANPRGINKSELYRKVSEKHPVKRETLWKYVEQLGREGFIKVEKRKARGNPHFVYPVYPEPYELLEKLKSIKDKIKSDKVREWRKVYEDFDERTAVAISVIYDLRGFVTLLLKYIIYDGEKKDETGKFKEEAEKGLDLFLFKFAARFGDLLEECVNKLIETYEEFLNEYYPKRLRK